MFIKPLSVWSLSLFRYQQKYTEIIIVYYRYSIIEQLLFIVVSTN